MEQTEDTLSRVAILSDEAHAAALALTHDWLNKQSGTIRPDEVAIYYLAIRRRLLQGR